MTTLEYLPEDELAERAISILIEALGPIETMRFLSLPRERQLDSVERHRQWQASLDPDEFLDRIFGAEAAKEEA